MAGAAAGKENAAKKQKGSKGYPKGVIETGRNTVKYQARVSYKPDGGKTVQRSAGTFNTPEEAALQMAAYEAKLAEGIDPWNGAHIRSQHLARPGVRSIPMFPCPRASCCRAPLAGLHLQAPLPARTERRRKVSKDNVVRQPGPGARSKWRRGRHRRRVCCRTVQASSVISYTLGPTSFA